jgi:hypothetical protein
MFFPDGPPTARRLNAIAINSVSLEITLKGEPLPDQASTAERREVRASAGVTGIHQASARARAAGMGIEAAAAPEIETLSSVRRIGARSGHAARHN